MRDEQIRAIAEKAAGLIRPSSDYRYACQVIAAAISEAVEQVQREADGWKDQAHEIALSNADHVQWHREARARIAELEAALAEERACHDCAEYRAALNERHDRPGGDE